MSIEEHIIHKITALYKNLKLSNNFNNSNGLSMKSKQLWESIKIKADESLENIRELSQIYNLSEVFIINTINKILTRLINQDRNKIQIKQENMNK